MTNSPDKIICYSCAADGIANQATIRIHKDRVLWPLYFCETHYEETKKQLNYLGLVEWDMQIQEAGFNRMEETSWA